MKHQKTKDIQKRYVGFLQTPALWKGTAVLELLQLEIPMHAAKIDIVMDEKARLGRYIERFVIKTGSKPYYSFRKYSNSKR